MYMYMGRGRRRLEAAQHQLQCDHHSVLAKHILAVYKKLICFRLMSVPRGDLRP